MKALLHLLVLLFMLSLFVDNARAQYLGGPNTGPCSRNTPHGEYCFCNRGVRRSRDGLRDGWYFDGKFAMRTGFSFSYNKGTHTAVCKRD